MNTLPTSSGGTGNDPKLSVTARTLLSIFALLLYGIAIWFVCSFSDYRNALVGLQLLSFSAFTIGVLALLRPWKSKVLTMLLIASLATAGVMAPRKAKATILPCVVAFTVIIVGVVVIVGMKKLCRLIPPPENKQEPPNNPTNAAPDIRISADADPTPMPVVHLDDDVGDVVACYAWSFQATDPYGSHYYRCFTTTLNSSPDLKTWNKVCKIQGWMSDYCVLTLYTNPQGVPILTNLSMITGTNQIVIPGQQQQQSAAFFRLSLN